MTLSNWTKVKHTLEDLYDRLRCYYHTRGKHCYNPVYYEGISRYVDGKHFRKYIVSDCILCHKQSKPIRKARIKELNMRWDHPYKQIRRIR